MALKCIKLGVTVAFLNMTNICINFICFSLLHFVVPELLIVGVY